MAAEKEKLWSDSETRLLLELWSEDRIQSQLRGNTRKGNVFKEIVEGLKARGYKREVQQCRKVRLLLLLKCIFRRFLSHTMDNSPKQIKNTIIAVAAIFIHTSARSCAHVICLHN